MQAGGLAALSLDVLFQVRFGRSRLRAGHPLLLWCNGCNATRLRDFATHRYE